MRLGSGMAVAGSCSSSSNSPIQPLAWELPYAAGSAVKKKSWDNLDKYNVMESV